jgi:hypothetical protein
LIGRRVDRAAALYRAGHLAWGKKWRESGAVVDGRCTEKRGGERSCL